LDDMTKKEQNYTTGFEDGFRAAAESLHDKIQAETWDEAFKAGYKACQEELGVGRATTGVE
jgi:hypothetical protein